MAAGSFGGMGGRGAGMVKRLSYVARGSSLLTAVGDLFTTEVRFPTEAFDMRLKSPRLGAGGGGGGGAVPGSIPGSIRQRVESFGTLTLQGVQQKLSDTLERQLGRFGPAGVELYRSRGNA